MIVLKIIREAIITATDLRSCQSLDAIEGGVYAQALHGQSFGFMATMAMCDFDRIYLAVQEFKQLRCWSNLRLDRSRLMDFCLNQDDWYTLYIPQAELVICTIADIEKQQEILIRLLQDYTDRFYRSLKTAYEGQFYDIVTVKEDDDTLLKVSTSRAGFTRRNFNRVAPSMARIGTVKVSKTQPGR